LLDTNEMTERLDPIRVRIISLGDVGTGKSSLIKRYCESRFAAKSIPTIGVDYGTRATSRKTNDGRQLEVKMDFFDLSGERLSKRVDKNLIATVILILVVPRSLKTNPQAIPNIQTYEASSTRTSTELC
jgi:GTPase SAR1 family protein